jgi:hypothetical protein
LTLSLLHDRRGGVLFGSDTTADGQWKKDLPRDGVDGSRERLAALERRGDVENDDLVDPLNVVPLRELAWIAGVTQLLELHALDHLPVTHVHAGDDALGQHARVTSRKLRMICRPVSLDFSGWNCTPNTLRARRRRRMCTYPSRTQSAVTGGAES